MTDERLVYPADGESLVARGDSFLDEGEEASLTSVLPIASDQQWTQFVRGMVCAAPHEVSEANALGMFQLMPRRLADLGIVDQLARRQMGVRAIWVAEFVGPLTCEQFLRSPQAQYGAFAQSMRDYHQRMQSGEIERAPGMSASEALAVLHRAGPRGLEAWQRGDRFPTTEKLVTRVAGVF